MSKCLMCERGKGIKISYDNVHLECSKCNLEAHHGKAILQYVGDVPKGHRLNFVSPGHVICPNCGGRSTWLMKACGNFSGNLFSKVNASISVGEDVEFQDLVPNLAPIEEVIDWLNGMIYISKKHLTSDEIKEFAKRFREATGLDGK